MENYCEIIERHLNGSLNALEQQWFNNELKNNPEFALEVALQKEVHQTISNKGLIEFALLTEEVGSRRFQPDSKTLKKNAFSRKKFIRIAASIAGIITSSMLIWWLSSKPVNEKLFTQYFEPYKVYAPILSDLRSSNNEQNNIKTAKQFYEKEQYKKAIIYFNQFIKKSGKMSNTGVYLYLGISYMQVDEFADAQKCFTKIIKSNDILHKQQAEWYLALSYLKSDDLNKSKQILENIANNNQHYKNGQARHLMEDLN